MTVTSLVVLRAVTCCGCGVVFGMPDTLVTERKRDHATFYCPNGHAQGFTGKSDTEKLRETNDRLHRQLAQESARADAAYDQAEAAERSARAYRGHATRLKNRVAKGKCPCCSKVFPDVAAHVATEHPGYPGDVTAGSAS